MTNQEAITKLTNIMHDDHYSWHPSILTAFGMAVDALRGADGDCISRQATIDAFMNATADGDKFEWCEWVLKQVPSAQSDKDINVPNTDTISRQAAIDSIESHIRTGDELYPLTYADKILNHAFEIAASCVYNLPSAQPEIKNPCSECQEFDCYGCEFKKDFHGGSNEY